MSTLSSFSATSPSERITVLIAHSNPILAAGLASTLKELEGVHVVIVARTFADQAVRDPGSRRNPTENPLEQAIVAAASGATRPSGGLPPYALRRVLEHLRAHLSSQVGLADLARITGLSEGHFARAFKESTGLPPHRYLMRLRITAAMDLIRESSQPLSQIALEVGFSDQSHFSRLFVQLAGETPRDFRRRHR